jgi:membrane-associated protease RseP (regulator of RpoE activity)
MSKKQLLFVLCLLASVACAAAVVSAQSAMTIRPAPQDESARAFALAFGGDGNYLGVYTETLTRENMSRYHITGEPRGVGVTQVAENSPAAKAGLQKGDVIVRFDGEEVSSTQKLSRLVSESAPEHTARLTVSRGGSEREISVTLAKREPFGALDANTEAWRSENGELFRWDGKDWQKQSQEEARKHSEEWRKQSEKLREQLERSREQLERSRGQLQLLQGRGGGFAFTLGAGRRIGVTTTQLTDQLADYFGVSREGGVLITSVAENSPAAKAGLKAGDIVTEVDGERIKGAGDLARLVSRKDEGDVTLTVTRERSRRTMRVTPEKSPAPESWTFPQGLFAAPDGADALTQLFVRPSVIAAPRVRVATPLVVTPQIRALPRLAPIPPVIVRPLRNRDARAIVQFLEL